MKRPSKALIQKWYAKAKKAGFQDCEQNDERERLTKWHSTYLQSRFTPEQYAAKESYYHLAADYLEHGTFETGKHKKIWGLHTEGLTITEIAKRCRATRTAVYEVISLYRSRFTCK
jgi:hypothetical protein